MALFDAEKVKLGIAPIGWCNDDMPELGAENTFRQTVSEMALAGFTGCEIGNKYPKDPKELKWELDLRGMRIASRWFSSFLLTKSLDENVADFTRELAFLAAVGADRINISEQSYSIQGQVGTPILTGGHKYVMNDAEWDRFTKGLDALGKIAVERGFKLCFHHHMGTVVQTAEETDRMMANTDPRYVFLCYDTGHFTFAGESEMTGIVAQEHIARIGVRHHAVGLLRGLHDRSHVVMEAELEAAFDSDLSERIQSFREAVPFRVVHYILVSAGQDRRADLPLNGIALLRDVDAVCADGGKEGKLPCKVRDVLIQRFRKKEGGEPAACDAHAAKIQLPFELLRILRVFVADLTARKTGQRHLADGLAERVFRAEFRHVVVAPADRGDAEFHFFCVKQCHGFSPFRFLRRRICAPHPRRPPPPRDRRADRTLWG